MSNVPTSSYLLHTPKGYFFRMRVPQQLQPRLQKRELKKALKTPDRAIAERQATLYAVRSFALFDSLQAAHMSEPTPTQMVVNTPNGTRIEIDKDNFQIEFDALVKAGVLDPAVLAQFPSAAMLSLAKVLGIDADTSPSEILQKLTAVLGPDGTAHPSAPPQIASHAAAPITWTPINGSMLLLDAIEVYVADIEKTDGNFGEAKKNELKSKFNILLKVVGNIPVNEIDYYKADKYRETYKQLPRNRTSAERKNMTLDELCKLDDPKKVSKETINQRLDTMSGLFNWLKKRD